MLLDTPKAALGWIIKPFSLKDSKGQTFELADLKGPQGTVIAFICNHCPYVKSIAKHLADDAKALQSIGVNLVAINSNDYHYEPEDSPQKMTEFSKRHGFTFPYLIDETQAVAKQYGAVCTPDFFGFNADGELQYRGRLDNSRSKKSINRNAELFEAMKGMAATGMGPEFQNPSIGCSIKWK